jgi:hypothetical protein
LATLIDVIGRTDDYAENFGFLLIAAATAAMPRFSTPRRDRLWGLCCWALAAGLLSTVITSFASLDANDPVLLALGLVVAPAWIVVLGARLDACAPGDIAMQSAMPPPSS